jgi:hypothetical protein
MALAAAVIAAGSAAQDASPEFQESPGILPESFSAEVLHKGVGHARHLAVTDALNVYVALDEPNQCGIAALRDEDGDGKTRAKEEGYRSPLLTFPGHWAPNDLLFYTGQEFLEEYRGGAFSLPRLGTARPYRSAAIRWCSRRSRAASRPVTGGRSPAGSRTSKCWNPKRTRSSGPWASARGRMARCTSLTRSRPDLADDA